MRQEANSTSDKSFKKPAAKTVKVPKKISETYLSNSGAYYLERFSASTEQFRRVMTRKIHKSCKAHPDQEPDTCFTTLETVIRRFNELGYLNDQSYAAGLTNSLRHKGWPRSRIIMRLKEKGISSDIIDDLLSDHQTDDDFKKALIWMKRKRLGVFATKERSLDKNLAALARAGFDYNTASRALALSKDDIEEIMLERD